MPTEAVLKSFLDSTLLGEPTFLSLAASSLSHQLALFPRWWWSGLREDSARNQCRHVCIFERTRLARLTVTGLTPMSLEVAGGLNNESAAVLSSEFGATPGSQV